MTGMQFYNSFLPPLPAGEYELTVDQEVSVEGPGTAGDVARYTGRQGLEIETSRFGLSESDVFALYPPAGSASDYARDLPHVVLSRRTLPWERTIGPAPEGGYVPPWMALLTLSAGEYATRPGDSNDPPSLTGTRSVPLTRYLTPPSPVVGPRFTSAEVARILVRNPDLHVDIVDVEADAFVAIAPALHELALLTHVRQIDVENQETSRERGEEGWFSVVVGNRLPAGAADGVYVAHLVSLEGFADYLPGSGWVPADGAVVRLASLTSWTFNSGQTRGGFEELMGRLDVGLLRRDPAPDLPEPAPPTIAVEAALRVGYVPLGYETLFGERTTAWYRGPCLPVPRAPTPRFFQAAGAAETYDPHTGLFDVSLAVAWQTGRSMALADRPFAAALVRWVREGLGLLMLAAERIDLLGERPAPEIERDLQMLFDGRLMRRQALLQLARLFDGSGEPGEGPFGRARNPAGLDPDDVRLPGLVHRADMASILAAGGEPTEAVVRAVLGGC